MKRRNPIPVLPERGQALLDVIKRSGWPAIKEHTLWGYYTPDLKAALAILGLRTGGGRKDLEARLDGYFGAKSNPSPFHVGARVKDQYGNLGTIEAVPRSRGGAYHVLMDSERGRPAQIALLLRSEIRGAARAKHNPAKSKSDRLFIGVYPGGIVYSDRGREQHGDYARLAFLPYDTLELQWEPGSAAFADVIRASAAKIQARRGEAYPISASGQTVRLGKANPGKAKRNPWISPNDFDTPKVFHPLSGFPGWESWMHPSGNGMIARRGGWSVTTAGNDRWTVTDPHGKAITVARFATAIKRAEAGKAKRNPLNADRRSACMDWMAADPTYRYGVDQPTRTAVMELAGNGGVFLTGKPRGVAEYAQAIYDDFMRAKRAKRNPLNLTAARARFAAAQDAYAMLQRAHGSAVVGWQEYKRAVARMSPAAIRAEAVEAVKRNPSESFDTRTYPTDRAAREARDARARALRASGTTVTKWASAGQEIRAGDLAWKDGKTYRHTKDSVANEYGLNYAKRPNPRKRNPSDYWKAPPADAHPAYKGSESMDYNWWVKHYAPESVRAELRAKEDAAYALKYPTPPRTAAQEREDAAWERRATLAEAREWRAPPLADRDRPPGRKRNPAPYNVAAIKRAARAAGHPVSSVKNHARGSLSGLVSVYFDEPLPSPEAMARASEWMRAHYPDVPFSGLKPQQFCDYWLRYSAAERKAKEARPGWGVRSNPKNRKAR